MGKNLKITLREKNNLYVISNSLTIAKTRLEP